MISSIYSRSHLVVEGSSMFSVPKNSRKQKMLVWFLTINLTVLSSSRGYVCCFIGHYNTHIIYIIIYLWNPYYPSHVCLASCVLLPLVFCSSHFAAGDTRCGVSRLGQGHPRYHRSWHLKIFKKIYWWRIKTLKQIFLLILYEFIYHFVIHHWYQDVCWCSMFFFGIETQCILLQAFWPVSATTATTANSQWTCLQCCVVQLQVLLQHADRAELQKHVEERFPWRWKMEMDV